MSSPHGRKRKAVTRVQTFNTPTDFSNLPDDPDTKVEAFAKQRSDTAFVGDFDNQWNWLVGDMRPFSGSPASFFLFMATTTGDDAFTAGCQSVGGGDDRIPWMTVELANLFLSSNTSHAWLTTRVRMLRNKTPCRVAQWLNEIPIPALKLQSQLLRKESSLEYFYTADHQEWGAQLELRQGASGTHAFGWAFLYGPTVDKEPGQAGYFRHDLTRPPFSEPFLSTCLQATLHGGPGSAFIEADGGDPNKQATALLPRNCILRLAVILHQQFKGLAQDEGPKLLKKMQEVDRLWKHCRTKSWNNQRGYETANFPVYMKAQMKKTMNETRMKIETQRNALFDDTPDGNAVADRAVAELRRAPGLCVGVSATDVDSVDDGSDSDDDDDGHFQKRASKSAGGGGGSGGGNSLGSGDDSSDE